MTEWRETCRESNQKYYMYIIINIIVVHFVVFESLLLLSILCDKKNQQNKSFRFHNARLQNNNFFHITC